MCGLQVSLFLLEEKMVAQCFDSSRVSLFEPLDYVTVAELNLFLVFKRQDPAR